MPIHIFKNFIRSESAGGIVLLVFAAMALLLDNSSYRYSYEHFLALPMTVHLGVFELSKSLLNWINEGLMTIFFFLVGLEIKREMVAGELDGLGKIALPSVAALGGMIVPALFYIIINWNDLHALRGWAIPTATDIAFALGVMSLLGKRILLSLKLFLTTIAIFDDIGAIIIIAIFYTATISALSLLFAFICLFILLLMNRFHILRQEAYIIVGIVLWLCVLKSGVHATLSGVAVAFAMPHASLRHLEERLLPWVSFVVLPLFALANAGVPLEEVSVSQLFGNVPLGILAGLFLGKQIGVFSASWLAVRSGIAKMPRGSRWLDLYAVAALCGIGFTMSLFIGTLAFYDLHSIRLVRLSVLIGSLLSGCWGILLFTLANLSRKGRDF